MSRETGWHPITQAWFRERFAAPTPAQALAWPAIAGGLDVLVTAPTGSGKTLAAFLTALDGLIRLGLDGGLGTFTHVVYVSPLKALSNDVRRNLEEPLAGLRAVAERLGYELPALRAAVRTGDTPASERRSHATEPPHILVTTPESLYILLTSESGRRGLSRVRTAIVDEIHAVLPDKRGAHLALSLERLDALVESSVPCASPTARVQRIGLSATVRPVLAAARFLVGGGRPEPTVVEVGPRTDADLAVEVPRDELGAVCTNEQWGELYDRVADLSRAHRSTLVFVNTRRLVERVAHALGTRLGEDAVAAHHGSLSRERRFEAERRLKCGDLRLVVATASLELGIDIGTVDLVCLVGSPRSIGTALQRIGRAGHAVGGTPKGRLFPLTRDQLVEAAAIVRAARRAALDEVGMREAPLDVLAQQIAAACAAEDWQEEALFDRCRRAAPYATLSPESFDAVLHVLTEGIETRRGRAAALLHRDSVAGRLRGRRGTRLLAITSGGAIPDNANYDVVLEPDGTPIGTIDEDFAIESMAGDVFLLGNTSWRIRRVESGRVRVEDAHGAAPTIPFWLGEGPARTPELSAEVAAVREEFGNFGADVSREERVGVLMKDAALDRRGAELAIDYLAAGRSALGTVPTRRRVVAERFFDEAGGMQLVLHAPFGGRINRAWGTALRKRFCRSFDFELQAAATDDGVVLSLGPQHSFPLESVFRMVGSRDVPELLTQAALQAPVFETRWRWNAMRFLAIKRRRGGKRVAPALLRMRAQDLLAAVFPAQTACQDNHGGGAIEIPDHPLVSETLRDCLVEAMDAEGLARVLHDIELGQIECVARETPEPSAFAHEILNANPYAFLDDAPLEERRTRAVTVRRGLPAELSAELGGLNPDIVAEVVSQARPDVRSADELHDMLLEMGAVPEAEGQAAGWEDCFGQLMAVSRATILRIDLPIGNSGAAPLFWVAPERRSLAAAIWPDGRFCPDLSEPRALRPPNWTDREGALAEVVKARLAYTGPTDAQALSDVLGLSVRDIEIALLRLEGEGAILRGRFLRPAGEATPVMEWCDRRLLARIHRRTLDGFRREIEPVPASDLIRFLLAWQHVRPGTQLHGPNGLTRVLGQLQGYEVAAGAWESEILPARLASYDPAWLDALCLSGEMTWGRLTARPCGSLPTRAAPIALVRRSELSWLLSRETTPQYEELSEAAREVSKALTTSGASFLHDLVALTRRPRTDVDEAIWELVDAGRVTGDGFAGLRALLLSRDRRPALGLGSGPRGLAKAPWRAAAGRWALLRAMGEEATDEVIVEAKARQYVARWGVVLRELLAREPDPPAWRELLRVYRRMEMRGELRGGRFVSGFVGEQFAAPEALEALRQVRKEPHRGERVEISACDPLNVVGVLTPGPRVPATSRGRVAYVDGVPVEPAEPERSRIAS